MAKRQITLTCIFDDELAQESGWYDPNKVNSLYHHLDDYFDNALDGKDGFSQFRVIETAVLDPKLKRPNHGLDPK